MIDILESIRTEATSAPFIVYPDSGKNLIEAFTLKGVHPGLPVSSSGCQELDDSRLDELAMLEAELRSSDRWS